MSGSAVAMRNRASDVLVVYLLLNAHGYGFVDAQLVFSPSTPLPSNAEAAAVGIGDRYVCLSVRRLAPDLLPPR